ncbi:hypothetical protein ACLOJK_016882 [Asimina triloba]
MKIQCDVCEKAEASVLCCADEAALCWACDEKVHAANKLAGKHQRLPLYNPSSQSPKCDICQEKAGYFFCLEDRALLCRQCDVSIHTASPFVSAHQRFLVTGVQVALQQHSFTTPTSCINPSTSSASNAASSGQPCDNKRRAVVTIPPAYAAQQMPSFRPHWPLDEMLLTGSEFDTGYQQSMKLQAAFFVFHIPFSTRDRSNIKERIDGCKPIRRKSNKWGGSHVHLSPFRVASFVCPKLREPNCTSFTESLLASTGQKTWKVHTLWTILACLRHASNSIPFNRFVQADVICKPEAVDCAQRPERSTGVVVESPTLRR